MEVKDILFMHKGDGGNSYAKNSGYTEKVAAETQAILYKAVESLLKENCSSAEVLNVADLACAAGPNTFTVLSTVLESTIKSCSELGCQVPEIQFYFNDLAGNDFNTLFKGLSVIQEKYKNAVSCFAMGAPGSFYGRLFPRNSMRFLHSSYGVNWLSKVPQITDEKGLPLNKGRIYLSESTPPAIIKAYASHFEEDFLLFLKFRSLEMVPNGRMVLIVGAKKNDGPVGREAVYYWELLSKAISYLVSLGLIDEGKLDSFNAPMYNPSQEEIEELVQQEGSFTVEFIETLVIDLGGVWSSAELRAKNVRSFTEPLISYHFGDNKEVMDKLYDKVTDMLVEDGKMQKPDHGMKNVTLVAVLKKRKDFCVPDQ